MENSFFMLEQSPKAFILASVAKKRITYFNKSAKTLYGIDENTFSLEDIFQKCPQSLEEMILSKLPLDEVAYFPDLYTVNKEGQEQVADLFLGFTNPDKSEIYFELTPRIDQREKVLKTMIDESSKAMFFADIEEQMTVIYANDTFYNIFSKEKLGFQTTFQNQFSSCLVGVTPETFFKEIMLELHNNEGFHQDIQLSTIHGVKKWFYLDLQYRPIENGVLKLVGMLLPIADRVEVVNQLKNLNRYFKAIQELTSGALFYINTKTKTGVHHSKLLKMAGFPERMDKFPYCLEPMIHPQDVEGFFADVEIMLAGGLDTFTVRYRTGTDVYSWAKLSGIPVYDDEDNIIEIVGKIENIDSELALLERATIDPLTSALNKDFVKEQVEKVLEDEPTVSHAFFFLDLDNFKYVNDNLGHTYGDFLLSELGRRMRQNVRSDDIIGRVGGDEFVLLLKNISNFKLLLEKAKRLLSTISTGFDDGNIQHTIYGSVGIAVFPEHGTTYEELYRHADLALYRSKERGKNMATIYQSTVPQKGKVAPPEEED